MSIVNEGVAAIEGFIKLVKEYGPGALDDAQKVIAEVKVGIDKAISFAQGLNKLTLEQTSAALAAGMVQLKTDMDAVDAGPKTGQTTT